MEAFTNSIKKYLSIKEGKVTESTLINYKHYLEKEIIPYFWDKNVDEIKAEDIKNFKEDITKKFSIQEAKNIYSLLKQILDLAVMDGTIETNYARLFKIEGERKSKIKINNKNTVLTDLETDCVCNYCENSLMKGGIGVVMSLKTGARKGEILSLRFGDIDLDSENPCINIKSTLTRYKNEKNTISYKISKTKTKFSKRSIPLSNEMKHILENYRKEYKMKFSLNNKELNECFLIPNKDPREFISPNKLDYYFRKLKKECKLDDKIHFHSLRHTFITKCIVEKNIPLSIVKYIVGHSTSASITVDTYTHINQDDVNNYRDKL